MASVESRWQGPVLPRDDRAAGRSLPRHLDQVVLGDQRVGAFNEPLKQQEEARLQRNHEIGAKEASAPQIEPVGTKPIVTTWGHAADCKRGVKPA